MLIATCLYAHCYWFVCPFLQQWWLVEVCFRFLREKPVDKFFLVNILTRFIILFGQIVLHSVSVGLCRSFTILEF